MDVTVANPSWAGADGAIVSDTADVNTFLRALVTGELLKPAQLRQMQTTVPRTSSTGPGRARDTAWV